jgi:uncharacterized tellurite resistance protein B-like protein
MAQRVSSPIRCNNGLVKAGDVVETCFDESIGGDGRIYSGEVEEVYDNGECKIRYPDGELWTVPAVKGSVIANVNVRIGGSRLPEQSEVAFVNCPNGAIRPGDRVIVYGSHTDDSRSLREWRGSVISCFANHAVNVVFDNGYTQVVKPTADGLANMQLDVRQFSALEGGIESYRTLVEMACADGWLTSSEDQRLMQARAKYGISILQHDDILMQVTGGRSPSRSPSRSPLEKGGGFQAYRELVNVAYLEGWLASGHDQRLVEARAIMGLSMYQHEQIVREVVSTNSVMPHQPYGKKKAISPMGNREVLQSAAGNLPLTVIQGPISSIRSEDNRDYAEGRVREVPTARCHNGIIRRGSRIKISMVLHAKDARNRSGSPQSSRLQNYGSGLGSLGYEARGSTSMSTWWHGIAKHIYEDRAVAVEVTAVGGASGAGLRTDLTEREVHYLELVQMAMADGMLHVREARKLDSARDNHQISVRRHHELMALLAGQRSGGQDGTDLEYDSIGSSAWYRERPVIAEYRELLEMAMSDGWLDHGEEQRLALERSRCGISLSEHHVLMAELCNGDAPSTSGVVAIGAEVDGATRYVHESIAQHGGQGLAGIVVVPPDAKGVVDVYLEPKDLSREIFEVPCHNGQVRKGQQVHVLRNRSWCEATVKAIYSDKTVKVMFGNGVEDTVEPTVAGLADLYLPSNFPFGSQAEQPSQQTNLVPKQPKQDISILGEGRDSLCSPRLSEYMSGMFNMIDYGCTAGSIFSSREPVLHLRCHNGVLRSGSRVRVYGRDSGSKWNEGVAIKLYSNSDVKVEYDKHTGLGREVIVQDPTTGLADVYLNDTGDAMSPLSGGATGHELAQYEKLVRMGCADGVLDVDEQQKLEAYRAKHTVPQAFHDQLMTQIVKEAKIAERNRTRRQKDTFFGKLQNAVLPTSRSPSPQSDRGQSRTSSPLPYASDYSPKSRARAAASNPFLDTPPMSRAQEVSSYRDLLAMACADGWLTSSEDQRLAQARAKYGISMAEHEQLMAVVTGSPRAGSRRNSPRGNSPQTANRPDHSVPGQGDGEYVLTRENLHAYYLQVRPDAVSKIDNILNKIQTGQQTASGIAAQFADKYGLGPELVWVPKSPQRSNMAFESNNDYYSAASPHTTHTTNSPQSGDESYLELLKMACADGWLDASEAVQLEGARGRHGISLRRHYELLALITGNGSFSHRPGTAEYTELLGMALVDGWLSWGEDQRLAEARRMYDISPAEHYTMMAEVVESRDRRQHSHAAFRSAQPFMAGRSLQRSSPKPRVTRATNPNLPYDPNFD